jgi:hypothetical protein
MTLHTPIKQVQEFDFWDSDSARLSDAISLFHIIGYQRDARYQVQYEDLCRTPRSEAI